MKLYELTQQHNELLDLIDQGVDPQVIIDTLEGVEGEIQIKATNIALMLKQMESDADALDTEIKRLSARKKSLENNHDRVKQYLEDQLTIAKVDKTIKSPMVSIWMQSNPSSVKVINESAIPKTYRIPQPDKIDKKAILEDLKAGKEVLGCELETEKKSLRIR